MKRLFAAAGCLGLAALAGCRDGVLDPQGPIAFAELQILADSTAIMLAIVVPTILATLGVAFWFRASNRRARYLPDFEHSSRLELLVWAIPILTVLLVGSVAWVASHDLDPQKSIESTARPVRVQVISLDWKWLFIYPDEGIATVNQLTIPVGRAVSFELTGDGVMNSFFVPQLGSQMYTMAGMVTTLNLRADRAGTYQGLSAEFSGDGFADMRFTVDAVSDGEYAKWIADAHTAGPLLDTATYTELAKPSKAVTPITYGTVASNFFDNVVRATAPDCKGQKT
jgi:cytochrome o ubiquinol oxidase subunit 2